MAKEVQAATLYLSPSSSTVTVGSITSVKILVATDGVAINNADAIIQFPTDLLEVVSVSKGSVFSLWIEDPKFSNVDGRISFNGGLPNPGYTGQTGEIASVVFRAKKAGSASLIFSDSAVRQNDGLGTDVLSSKQPGVITVSAAAQTETRVVPSVTGLPAAPVVTSSTHPEQNNWYSGTSATFSWKVPQSVISVQTLLSKNAKAVPSITYDNSVSQRTVENLEDGILYFHIRYMNGLGWGPIARYKVQLDSTQPNVFEPEIFENGIRHVITLNAQDETSGIDYYTIGIDGEDPIRVEAEEVVDGVYTLPVQSRGPHQVFVSAFDKAGNHTDIELPYKSNGPIPPVIGTDKAEINTGEPIVITGQTQYPLTQVQITLDQDGQIGTFEATTDENGYFIAQSNDIKEGGLISVSAELVFSRNVRSLSSERIMVRVHDTSVIALSKYITQTFIYAIPAIVVFFGLLYVIWLGWHKFFGLRRRMRKELDGFVDSIHDTLTDYKYELNAQLNALERLTNDRDLTKEEERIFNKLKKNIDSIDEAIEKKIRKIK